MCVFTNKFPLRLKELRKKSGLTKKEISQAVGISQAALLRWESGLQVPQVDSAKILADFYGVSLEYLLGQKDN